MKIIDCKGMICPMPLIETRKAIRESAIGEDLQVIVDNETSFNNVSHFLNDNGYVFNYTKEGNVYTISFNVSKIDSKKEEVKPIIENKTSKFQNHIIVLSSNTMGIGDDDLGKLLMKGYLNTIDQLDVLPLEIICYNSGVTLAEKGTDSAQTLKKIENQGVKITLCGTCVDFFGLKEKLEVGTISNMLYIAGRLSSGIQIVKP